MRLERIREYLKENPEVLRKYNERSMLHAEYRHLTQAIDEGSESL